MPTTVNHKLAGTWPDLRTDQGRTGKTGVSSRLGAHGKTGIEPSRFAPNLDGVDDYAVLTNRAINVDGDNSFEFWSPDSTAVAATVVAQNISSTSASREFQLYANPDATSLLVIWGGSSTTILSAAQGYEPNRKFFVSFVGNNYSIAKNTETNIIRTGAFTRGAAREPTAQTVVGARGNGAGLFSSFSKGIQRDIKINGVLWQMVDRNQAIQLPTPTGLGAELITPTVLANPISKGTQWTYLDDGRWQYVGDGTLNQLQFLLTADQPAAGFLEFDIESIVGVMTCSIGSVAGSSFSAAGRFRYFYTNKDLPSANASAVQFKRAGTSVASCIIKNISFKPLGTCNPMQLVNTSSDRWQEIIP